ncbi:hypothetical protein [Microbacterium sp. 18062]|uniref:hypothetical protein n=1 Tax=Microbacterium sp. 18062 TaxID=2681410 RepID=UPI0013575262|nr:hypothetical protein [Microbacterium sp. 18062]
MRAEVVGPLIAQATTDGTRFLTAQKTAWEASRAQARARGLRKRAATRAADAAHTKRENTETTTRQRWGSIPHSTTGIDSWAESVAQPEAETNPRVIDAMAQADSAREVQRQLTKRHLDEQTTLIRRVFGDRAPTNPTQQAARWQQRAKQARRDLTIIEALPTTEAAQLIQERAELEQARRKPPSAPRPHGRPAPPSSPTSLSGRAREGRRRRAGLGL